MFPWIIVSGCTVIWKRYVSLHMSQGGSWKLYDDFRGQNEVSQVFDGHDMRINPPFSGRQNVQWFQSLGRFTSIAIFSPPGYIKVKRNEGKGLRHLVPSLCPIALPKCFLAGSWLEGIGGTKIKNFALILPLCNKKSHYHPSSIVTSTVVVIMTYYYYYEYEYEYVIIP